MMGIVRKLGVVRLGWVVAVVTLALDQLHKNVMLYGFDFISRAPQDAVEVTPFFNLVMVWNYGVSFGMFQADSVLGRVVLAGFSLLVVALLSVWLMRARNPLLALGLGMVIGGAVSNVINRVVYGAVADFFDFHVAGYHWYIFNIADVGIVAGVGVLILDSLWNSEDETSLQKRSGSATIKAAGENSAQPPTGNERRRARGVDTADGPENRA